MIAEDDGEIDIDLPELQRDDYISKFGFRYLGIIESGPPPVEEEEEKKKIVKVHYEDGGSSTIALQSLNTSMSEILTLVIRKRRLHIDGYELERKDAPGEIVNLNSSLASQGTMDFLLVTNKHRTSSFGSEDEESASGSQVKVQLTSHQYKSFNVSMVQRVRSNARVQLGIDPQRIEIQPIDQHGKGFFRSTIKPIKYNISSICACKVLEEKPSGVTTFRIVGVSSEGIKNIDMEAPSGVAKEIVAKLNLILGDVPSAARAEYERNEGEKSRKIFKQ